MKQFVFLVRDPGAYEAIYAVFLALCTESSVKCDLFCFGTAAKMNAAFAASETDTQRWIENHIRDIDVLICGTGFHTEVELSLMEKCGQHGIRTVAILDYWSMYKNRFLANERFIWPDFFLVMDTIAEREAIEDGVPASIIKVLGHPGLDRVIKQGHKKYGDAMMADSVLLLGEPMDIDDGDAYEDRFFLNCIHVLMSMKKDFSIKFHPRESEYIKKKYRQYSAEGNLLDVIQKYDIIIGITTIALLQAALAGKHTISYQPRMMTKDECISSRFGLSKLVTSQEELATVLQKGREYLKNCGSLHDFLWMDGKSTERIVRFLKGV